MRYLDIGWVAALAVLWAGAAAAQEGSKVSLRANTKVGEKYTETSTFETVGKLRVKQGGQEQEFALASKKEEVVLEEVLGVQDGLPIRLSRRYVVQRTSETSPGSSEPKVEDGPLAGRTFVIDGIGSKRKVTCASRDVEAAELRRVENSPVALILPAAPVSPGATWEVPGEVVKEIFFSAGEETPEKASLKCRFVDVVDHEGKRCARLALDLALVAVEEGGKRMSLDTQGQLLFALDEGAAVKMDLKGKLTVSARQGEGEKASTYQVEGEVTIALARAAARPEAEPTPGEKEGGDAGKGD